MMDAEERYEWWWYERRKGVWHAGNQLDDKNDPEKVANNRRTRRARIRNNHRNAQPWSRGSIIDRS